MKAREGFVSNSSSSSFVIIGKRISQGDIKSHKNVLMIGENCDGYEAIELNDELKDAILEHDIDCEFWEAFYTAFDADNTLTAEAAVAMVKAAPLEVETLEVTHWDSYEQEGIDGFLHNYLDDYYDPDKGDEDEENEE